MNQVTITLEQFRVTMLAAGYDEVIERRWEANTLLEWHSHPFEANAIVVGGEMWLGMKNEAPRRLLAGDTFHLIPGVQHTEKYGASGATYWVARRNAGME